MVPVEALTTLLTKSTGAFSAPPGAPATGTTAISRCWLYWFWICASLFCGSMKETLMGWIWVMVTSGWSRR